MSDIAHTTALDIKRVYAGKLCVDATWRLDRHQHAFHELIVIYQGALGVRIHNHVHTARPGDILFYAKDAPHEEWVQESPLELIYLGFEWENAPEELPLIQRDQLGRIREMAIWIMAEEESYFEGVAAYHTTLTQALLREFLRLAHDQEDQMVKQVRAYVRAHLHQRFSLEELAQIAGLSKYYFSRTYHNLTGLSPMQDVRRIRLERARYLLLSTRLPLKAIAPQVGFANEYHISRLLKQCLGVGARELRKKTLPPI